MISTSTAVSQEFQSAAARAVALLGSASARLQAMRNAVEGLLDQTDLLHLSSMAQLAACRGWHFINDETSAKIAVSSACDVTSQLTLAHQLLVEHATGLDSFEVLQFVDEVGGLCLEMRRYVDRH